MNAGAESNTNGAAERRVHVIRLRGPWEYRVLRGGSPSRSQAARQQGRMQMPADWGETLGDDFRGRVAYTRHFARPTGLRPDLRVELVLTGVDALGTASLNGTALLEIPPGGGVSRVEIGSMLRDRNRLVVEVELPEPHAEVAAAGRETNSAAPSVRPPGREQSPGGLFGEVRLEIHERSP